MESFQVTVSKTTTVTCCARCPNMDTMQGFPICMILQARCNGQDPDKFIIGTEGRDEIPDYCPLRESKGE